MGGNTMLKDKFVLVGVAGLAAVATAGWVRQPHLVSPATTVSNFQPLRQESAWDASQQPVNPSALYVTGPVQPFSTPAAAAPVSMAARRQSEPMPVRSAAVRRAPVAYDDRPVVTPQKRSTKASAAIIGGSAAAGAAIGGLAGGGKGAIIGAVAGGAAGTVYDRMTYKKQGSSREVTDASYNREGRSTLERAAIIGGGAAAGAAIGGAAAGGKGAAIGALGGGAAGYVYDRVTRNK
jgi:hypothetical protein